MAKYRFIRDTNPREDSVEHKAGEVVDLTPEQVARWERRGAVEPASNKPKPQPAAVAAEPNE